MKLMIISDIHGSAYFCQKAMDIFDQEKPDKLLILGDILYHGPRNNLPNGYEPKEVARMLNERKDKIMCVHGNCDAEVDQFVLDFPIFAEYAELELDGKKVLAVHGHKLDREQRKWALTFDAILFGHIHVPKFEKWEGVTIVNPGSLSIPKEDSENGYAMYDKGIMKVKTLSGKTVFEGTL